MNYKKSGFLYFIIRKIIKPIYLNLTKIKGQNNRIIKKSYVDKLSYRIIGNNNTIIFEEGCDLGQLKVFVAGNNNRIIVSNNCTVKSVIFWIEDNNCEIFIGENTTIESADFSVSEDESKILVGSDCMFSSNVKIMTGDSHSILDENYVRINHAKDVVIGNHVWIGAEAVILKGSNLEENCVIGTRTLVTGSFASGKLICGSPAKIIKNNINWDRRRI